MSEHDEMLAAMVRGAETVIQWVIGAMGSTLKNTRENTSCSDECKRAAQNKRYYQTHRNQIIQRVMDNRES